jgi:glycosyltransferase involved in cell wall biosynthesis
MRKPSADSPAPAAAPRVLIVSPCRDEERTVERTIACMRAQTRPPVQWIVVDDGSRDRTPALLDRAAAEIPWLRVVHRRDRGHRALGSGVIEAFEAGLESADVDYDFVAKLDVDLEFPATYLERALRCFEEDPELAAVSGKVYRRERGRLVEEFMIDEMVAGQFKLYRRDAFESMGGFVRGLMWDGIDFHRARLMGYRTASIADPELRIVHLRMMGSSDRSIYRGRLRHGRGQWFMGSAFPYVVASGLFRMGERPYVVGGLLMIAGYVQAALKREPRYGDERFRKGLRAWQYARLRRLFGGGGPR